MAFSAFIFPMVASSKAKDSASLKVLSHSVIGTAVVGVAFALVLLMLGRYILGLSQLWQPYSNLSGLMALLALNTTASAVGGCLLTYETAQGRFRFLWYAVPIILLKAAFLYCITGYTFFDGILPESVLVLIKELNPCRLSFLTIYFTVTQFVFTAMLAVDVFCKRRTI
jgi:hypothetical protein